MSINNKFLFSFVILLSVLIVFSLFITSANPALGGGGGGCSDQCSPSGKRTCCNNQKYKRCGDYDADSCLEWSSCRSCGNDGWRNVGSSYDCCDGNQKCDCQDQEYRDYYCSGGSCRSRVTNTRTVKSNCTDCSNQGTNCGYGTCQEDEKPTWSCSGGNCNYNCNYDVSCVPDECDSDSDCDDNNPCTIDSCNNPLANDSTCSYSNKSAGTDCGNCKECDGAGNCNSICQGNESSCECVSDSCIDCSDYYGTNCGYDTCQSNEKPSWSCSGGSCSYNCNYDVSCLKEPGVETNAASNIQEEQATLNGDLTSLGGTNSCNVWFEWGVNTSYGNETTHRIKDSTGSFSETITGLNPGMTYHFRAVAENSQGISYGNDKAFSTILGGDVTGFGWIGANCTNPAETSCGNSTKPIGWVSFSSDNPEISCSGSSYGVSVNYNTGEISGAALIGVGEDSNYGDCNTNENTVGWIYFDSSDTPSFGSSYSYNYPAQIVSSEVRGWAPIISKDENGNQTIVTWVRFRGSNYSVEINSDGTVGDPGGTNHYAWAGFGSEEGLGWIDFRNQFSPVIFPSANQDPTVSNMNDPDDDETYCGVGAGKGHVGFEWQYNDPDNDDESRFDIRVNNINNVNDPNPEVNFTNNNPVCDDPDPSPPKQCTNTYGAEVGTDLDYATNYYWWVRVYDDHGNDSGWVQGPDFRTSEHAWPDPNFSCNDTDDCSSITVSEEEAVTLKDTSTYYAPRDHCEWTLPPGSTVATGTPSSDCELQVKFKTGQEQEITLDAYDVSGYHCSHTEKINVSLELPEWEEIPPY